MTWQPWPGHPCFDHGCDGCAVCRSGRCCAADSTDDCSHDVSPGSAISRAPELRDAITNEAASQRPSLAAVVLVEALLRGAQPVAPDLVDQVKSAAQRQLRKGWTP